MEGENCTHLTRWVEKQPTHLQKQTMNIDFWAAIWQTLKRVPRCVPLRLCMVQCMCTGCGCTAALLCQFSEHQFSPISCSWLNQEEGILIQLQRSIFNISDIFSLSTRYWGIQQSEIPCSWYCVTSCHLTDDPKPLCCRQHTIMAWPTSTHICGVNRQNASCCSFPAKCPRADLMSFSGLQESSCRTKQLTKPGCDRLHATHHKQYHLPQSCACRQWTAFIASQNAHYRTLGRMNTLAGCRRDVIY